MHLESNDDFFADPASTPVQRQLSPLLKTSRRRLGLPSSFTPSSAESHDASSLSDLSVSDTASSPPRDVVSKKRKLEKNTQDIAAATSSKEMEWEPINEFYSRRKISNSKSVYRCTPCLESGNVQLCRRDGDILRHLQSKKHAAKSYFCSRCASAFTRKDALKRHTNKCFAKVLHV